MRTKAFGSYASVASQYLTLFAYKSATLCLFIYLVSGHLVEMEMVGNGFM